MFCLHVDRVVLFLRTQGDELNVFRLVYIILYFTDVYVHRFEIMMLLIE